MKLSHNEQNKTQRSTVSLKKVLWIFAMIITQTVSIWRYFKCEFYIDYSIRLYSHRLSAWRGFTEPSSQKVRLSGHKVCLNPSTRWDYEEVQHLEWVFSTCLTFQAIKHFQHKYSHNFSTGDENLVSLWDLTLSASLVISELSLFSNLPRVSLHTEEETGRGG